MMSIMKNRGDYIRESHLQNINFAASRQICVMFILFILAPRNETQIQPVKLLYLKTTNNKEELFQSCVTKENPTEGFTGLLVNDKLKYTIIFEGKQLLKGWGDITLGEISVESEYCSEHSVDATNSYEGDTTLFKNKGWIFGGLLGGTVLVIVVAIFICKQRKSRILDEKIKRQANENNYESVQALSSVHSDNYDVLVKTNKDMVPQKESFDMEVQIGTGNAQIAVLSTKGQDGTKTPEKVANDNPYEISEDSHYCNFK